MDFPRASPAHRNWGQLPPGHSTFRRPTRRRTSSKNFSLEFARQTFRLLRGLFKPVNGASELFVVLVGF